mgnify:FL=1
MTRKEIAKSYREKLNWSIIPVRPDKKPCISWEKYQSELPTIAEIDAWWTQFPDANLAVVTGSISGICVIDIDTSDGLLRLSRLLGNVMTLNTPISLTPRGGSHIYFSCNSGDLSNNTGMIEGCDFRANGGYVLIPPSTNGSKVPYKWKKMPSKVKYLPLPAQYAMMLEEHLSNDAPPVTGASFLEHGNRDASIFHVANSLSKGNVEKGVVQKVCTILGKNSVPEFPEKECLKKVESAFKRQQSPIKAPLLNWIDMSSGYFTVKDICSELNFQSRAASVRNVLHRLCQQGVLDRHRNQNGMFRRVDTECNTIDFIGSTDEPLDIKYPFQLEKYIRTYPGNIQVIAGSPDTGKTGFLLNFTKLNMENHKINYFSSEMGGMELKSRLLGFDFPLEKWKFNPVERASNFADVIKPNEINIIDFLEIYENHYLIGQWIKDIFDKLEHGIALIAIQKKHGHTEGVGGLATLEKPRLYLTIDRGIIRIKKAKNWVYPNVNPNGLALRFKIHKGAELSKMDGEDWTYEAPV